MGSSVVTALMGDVVPGTNCNVIRFCTIAGAISRGKLLRLRDGPAFSALVLDTFGSIELNAHSCLLWSEDMHAEQNRCCVSLEPNTVDALNEGLNSSHLSFGPAAICSLKRQS